MRKVHSAWVCAALVLLILLGPVPAAFAQSAVDQYSEAIPTAGGQKSTHAAVTGGGGGTAGGGTAQIPPKTSAQLHQTKTGDAAEKTARLTAPNKSSSSNSGGSSSDSGMGLVLPLILAASLLGAIAIFIARRRAGAAAG
jgi:hypothetical protein